MTPSRNILKKLEDKALIVEYVRGSGGNLVQRIIASDNKFYWDADINNSFCKESNPIYWPEKGFIPQQKYVNNDRLRSLVVRANDQDQPGAARKTLYRKGMAASAQN